MRCDEEFTVDGHVSVQIELAAGNVTVRTGESGRVRVTSDSAGSRELDAVKVGDSVCVRQGRRNRSAQLALDVPVGTDVSIKGTSLQVVTRGALGALRSRTTSGDLLADDVVRLDVSMSSGDARVGIVRHDATITTVSGDVVIASVGGRCTANSASGDLRLERVGGDIEAGSASGDLTVGRCDGATIALRTLSGDIRVGLPAGIRVEPEISTMSGSIRLPERTGAGTTPGERRAVRLRLRTVSGDVRVDRV